MICNHSQHLETALAVEMTGLPSLPCIFAFIRIFLYPKSANKMNVVGSKACWYCMLQRLLFLLLDNEEAMDVYYQPGAPSGKMVASIIGTLSAKQLILGWITLTTYQFST